MLYPYWFERDANLVKHTETGIRDTAFTDNGKSYVAYRNKLDALLNAVNISSISGLFDSFRNNSNFVDSEFNGDKG